MSETYPPPARRPGDATEGAQWTLVVDMHGGPGSVHAAREAAADFLDRARLRGGPGARGLSEATATDVLLVVAELVANACRHAPGPCRMTLLLTDRAADISVHDTGPGLLRLVPADGQPGYGLFIVARLTDGIHVLPSDDGKIVRAVVPLPRYRLILLQGTPQPDATRPDQTSGDLTGV